MKKLISVVLCLVLVLGLVACGGAAGTKMTMGTGGTSGTYYAFGGVLFHMLFGISPISSFPYFLALIGLAGYGLSSLVGLLHSSKRRDDPLSRRKKKSIYRKFPSHSKANRRADKGETANA